MNFKVDWLDFSDPSYFIKEYEVDPSWINDFDESYREYRNRWHKANNERVAYGFPLCLEVESSYYCNFSCPNCPRFAAKVPLKGNMSVETFKILMKSCKGELDSIFLDHGGEATLNENLPLFVKLSRDAGIKDIMISTNASVLTEKISKELIENGITKINFSIDAASSETYSITRPGGKYEKTLENIRGFLEAKRKYGRSYPRVRVSFIVQDANVHEVEDFYKEWQDKVNLIAFQKAKDFKKILGNNVSASSVPDYKFNCSQVFTTLMVNFKGNIHICNHDYNHEHLLGNLRNVSIEDAWNSNTMKNLREIHSNGDWAKFQLCTHCVMGSI